MRYRIVIEQDEDGIYVAECPSLPGCVSQGNTCTAHDFLDTVVAVLDPTSKAPWSAIGAPTPIV